MSCFALQSKAGRCSSLEALDTEGMKERIPQVLLKRKSEEKMVGGRERRGGKNRDFMGFKGSCLILCGLIHNCCMPGVGSSTSGSHQQESGSGGQGTHMLNFIASKQGGGRNALKFIGT